MIYSRSSVLITFDHRYLIEESVFQKPVTHMYARSISLLFLLLGAILLPCGFGQTNQAKVLVAGLTGEIKLASAWLEIDPLTDPRTIPARAQDSEFTMDQLHRFIRVYFPRTYEDLLTYEYMILAQIEVWLFTNEQQKMLHDAVIDGLGGMQTRSVMSMHTGISIPWANSILSDAFPNDADAVVAIDYRLHSDPMRVVINTNPEVPPIYKPYKDLPGVEYSFGGAYGTNLAIPKEGAVIASYSVGPYGYGFPGTYPDPNYKDPGWIPHSMYWKFGKGITWTHQDMFGQYWNTIYNPYAPDMVLSEIIFSTGRELPEDVVMVHRLRVKFSDYAFSKDFIYSLLDFIDKFGANTAPVVDSLLDISDTENEAKQLYLEQSYELSSATMDRAMTDLTDLRETALRLKDRALLWIYIIEWLAVSGISLVAGFSLWTLMIKRRLYREVSVTRMR